MANKTLLNELFYYVFIRYFAALAYDAFIIVVLFFALTAVLLLFHHGQAIAPGTFWYQCSLMSIVVIYYCCSIQRGGQTLGMRAWRFKLSTRDGRKPATNQVIARMLYFIPAFCIAPLCLVGAYTLLHRWTRTTFVSV